MNKIRNILLAGGTHGNERTGVRLIEKINSHKKFFDALCPSAKIETLLSNPNAALLNRRYEHQDLNRSFAAETLNIKGETLCSEVNRAKKINERFGPKGQNTKTDLLIDIHNTTANMGFCLILSERDPFTMRASAVLTREFSNARIYYQPEERSASPYLGTIAKADICLEIGPQCHGTLNARLFFQTEKIIERYLELAEEWNKGELQKRSEIPVEVFTQFRDIDYPRENGKITAMIHPNLLGKDYAELKSGMPLFKTFEGEDILYEGESVWPIFIDEAAYYEKKIAMSFTLRTEEKW